MAKPEVQPAGYSGTPLVDKLGLKENFKIRIVNRPGYYFDLLPRLPKGIRILTDRKTKKDQVHYFVKESKELMRAIPALKDEIEQNGTIWISWPKKSSGVETDVTEDVVRKSALSNGLVDVKVCAIDEMWSGLKLVIPVKNRK
ncbi:MAG TPA: DUF3052 family protein [Candidatus Kryptonia bacterium]